MNITDLDSAQRAARTLAGELGSTPVAWGQPPGNLQESDLEKQFQAMRSTFKTHYLMGILSNLVLANLVTGIGDLLGQARLGPNALNRNVLDAKSRDLALELRSIATVARTLTALNDAHAPLLDGAKAVADSVADLMKLLMGSGTPFFYIILLTTLSSTSQSSLRAFSLTSIFSSFPSLQVLYSILQPNPPSPSNSLLLLLPFLLPFFFSSLSFSLSLSFSCISFSFPFPSLYPLLLVPLLLLFLIFLLADAPDTPSFETALEAVEKQITSANMLLEKAELLAHTDKGAHLLMVEVCEKERKKKKRDARGKRVGENLREKIWGNI
jgi:hypothetical protein